MRLNKKGFVIEGAALVIIGILSLFIIPQNPISSALNIGIRPNKTIESKIEKVDLLKDSQGNIIGTKTTTSSSQRETQDHVTFWEWLRSLPIFAVLLMGLGVVFPPVALFLGRLWSGLKRETKKIVVSVDKALDNIHDKDTKESILKDMSSVQDTSTKKLVDKIQGK